jgi:hypothetical protein
MKKAENSERLFSYGIFSSEVDGAWREENKSKNQSAVLIRSEPEKL